MAAILVCLGVPTLQDFTKLSAIPIELLLICVQCQFKIPVVTQGKWFVVSHADYVGGRE